MEIGRTKEDGGGGGKGKHTLRSTSKYAKFTNLNFLWCRSAFLGSSVRTLQFHLCAVTSGAQRNYGLERAKGEREKELGREREEMQRGGKEKGRGRERSGGVKVAR